jgi:hypothetical protein
MKSDGQVELLSCTLKNLVYLFRQTDTHSEKATLLPRLGGQSYESWAPSGVARVSWGASPVTNSK